MNERAAHIAAPQTCLDFGEFGLQCRSERFGALHQGFQNCPRRVTPPISADAEVLCATSILETVQDVILRIGGVIFDEAACYIDV